MSESVPATTQPARRHLVIGTPCYGSQITSVFAISLLKLQLACLQRGNLDMGVLLQGGDALITRARQNVVAHFLGNPAATHLLFIDADIGFEPDQVFRLLDFDADMSAAVYPTKKIDWEKVRVCARTGRERLESAALSYVIEFLDPAHIGVDRGFTRVRYAGTGFLMIKREVLESMQAHYPELRYTREHQAHDPLSGSPHRSALFDCLIDKDTGTYLSEDFSFCRRWTDMGGAIWADTESRLTHTGPLTFTGDLSTQFAAN